MPLAEVIDLNLVGPGDPRLEGCSIDLPRQGQHVAVEAIQIFGWVIGAQVPVRMVEARQELRPVARVAAGELPRPDVAAAYPAVLDAEDSGFELTIELVEPQAESVLELYALLADGTDALIGQLRLRRRWREQVEWGTLVSIVIPSLSTGSAQTKLAIEHALAQQYPHIEVVISGRLPRTVTDSFADFGVRVVPDPPVSNVGDAWNLGLRRSNGDLLTFVAPGELLTAPSLTAGIEALAASPEAAVAIGESRGESAREWGPGAMLLRRSAFEFARGFRTAFGSACDVDLYLRIAAEHPTVHHETLVTTRSLPPDDASGAERVLRKHRRTRRQTHPQKEALAKAKAEVRARHSGLRGGTGRARGCPAPQSPERRRVAWLPSLVVHVSLVARSLVRTILPKQSDGD